MSTQIITTTPIITGPTTVTSHTPSEATQAPPTRQERAAQMTATVDAACERLAEQLAAGHSEAYLAFLAFHARFHRYSAANALLILSQCPEATRVAGLATWNRLGYRVRAGEKALWIWAPVLRKGADPATGEEGETLVGFRPAPVFDASQLANLADKPLPELTPRLPDDVEPLYQAAVRRITATGITVREQPLPAGIAGASQGGCILIKSGQDSRNRLFTLLHELVHELAHHGEGQREKSRQVRELEAEASAFVVAATLGLESVGTRDYLLTYKVSAEDLRRALGSIQRLVRQVLAIVAPEAEPVRLTA